jgi:hypothetical protein
VRGPRPRKQGAALRLHPPLGYHPLLASRADSGEVLHARQRTGRANPARGTARLVEELAARVRRPGRQRRADHARRLRLLVGQDHPGLPPPPAPLLHHRPPDQADPNRYSITVRQTRPIRAAIAAVDGQAWVDIVYPDGGLAQLAETRYRGDRLVVRRTRLVGA